MIEKPMDILTYHEVRKTKRQKAAFRDSITEYAEKLGYPVTVEKGSFGARNLILGDPTQAKFLITAHYDTCAWMPFPNFCTPCHFWAYLVYQILVTLGFLAVAFALGFLGGLVAGEARLGGMIAWALLLVLYGLLLFGPANRHTANDNTSGVVALLEIAATLQKNMRSQVCFVLFDLEEAGLIGSSNHQRKHKKETASQIVLNLDCVGDGDHIVMFPTKKLRKDTDAMELLRCCVGSYGDKRITLHEKGFSMYASDQRSFPKGVGVAALRKKGNVLYLSRIHTHKDTILEETNVNLLRAALTSMIGRAALQKGKEEENETL